MKAIEIVQRAPGSVQDDDGRSSGVFLRQDRVGRSPSLDEALGRIRVVIPEGVVGLLLEPSRGRPLRARVTPVAPTPADLGFVLELRLKAWTSHIGRLCAPAVPEYLRAWFPFERAFVVPIATEARRFGVLVVQPGALNKTALRELEALAQDLAAEMEAADVHLVAGGSPTRA